MTSDPILLIENLRISFPGKHQETVALKGLGFGVERGKVMGLVGASGSGKTLTALSILGLAGNFSNCKISGNILFFPGSNDGVLSLLELNDGEWCKIRGRKIAMVFQNPGTSLNPVFTCGKQLFETLGLAGNVDAYDLKQKALGLLKEVEFENPEKIFKAYPHELSGGQKQRVMIALALASAPELLIADEPTSSLDENARRGIIELFRKIKESRSFSILLISHDQSLVAELADQTVVLYGETTEEGSGKKISHLQRNHVEMDRREGISQVRNEEALIEAVNLGKSFSERGIFRHNPAQHSVFQDVSFKIFQGETLGVVGPSGCGKSTLARIVCGLESPNQGVVLYGGRPISQLLPSERQIFRKNVQIIFQDPYTSFNPVYTIGNAISEALLFHKMCSPGITVREKVHSLLESVGLAGEIALRFPHELSGGQLQRANIARALALEPQLLVCDEPTSSLDTESQARVLQLLKNLQDNHKMSLMFISHNLPMVQGLSHTMYRFD